MKTPPLTAEEIGIVNRIADLMEKGSAGRRQTTGHYFNEDGTEVCSFGACLIAAGVKPSRNEDDKIDLRIAFGIVQWPKIMYPNGIAHWRWLNEPDEPMPLDDAIISLNDTAGWRFGQIVSWLRSVANQASVTE